MSIIPLRLPRSPSTLSILRSLETLSPPPSWSSLDNLAGSCQVGSIPIILHAGLGDLGNMHSDNEQDDPNAIDSFDLVSEVKSVPNHNIRAVSSTSKSKPLKTESLSSREAVGPCVHHHCPWRSSTNTTAQCQEETRPTERQVVHLPQPSAIQSLFELVPQTAPNFSSTPELSPGRYLSGRLWSVSHDGTASKHSPVSCSTLSTARRASSPSISESGNISESCSNRPLNTCDAVHGRLETSSVDFACFPLLPASLSWLQSTALEIMIDQEGYRVIQPIFRFAGYSPLPTTKSEAMHHGAQLISGTADFMPAQRKSFVYHHTALETPPVLRRLMVNGDEYHDYLSRQAYLVLQSNGPYTVQGIEPVHTSRLFSNAEPVLLAWRFDYVVGDRRTDTGRIIPGEKTLTPLSFSCSPALLWPTQARKIRVVHVVRKSVATKLTATKIEPPTPPHPDLAPLYSPDSKSQETTSSRHQRVRSHALQSAQTHRIPTLDSALTSSVSFHGMNGSFPTQLL